MTPGNEIFNLKWRIFSVGEYIYIFSFFLFLGCAWGVFINLRYRISHLRLRWDNRTTGTNIRHKAKQRKQSIHNYEHYPEDECLITVTEVCESCDNQPPYNNPPLPNTTTPFLHPTTATPPHIVNLWPDNLCQSFD